MKNKKNIKTIPVVVISTFVHYGIDWLHSFIDSYKEVLIVPPLSFFKNIIRRIFIIFFTKQSQKIFDIT